jgi:hypothetical protein
MKVTHCDNEHLVCLTSDEVALLVDLCHAGAFSDELVQEGETRRRLQRFLGEMQNSLFETAQSVWQRQRAEDAEATASESTTVSHGRG